MSSPASLTGTLASNASSAPDRQETYAVNLPVPVTATAPKATTKTAYLPPASAATSKPKYAQPPSPSSANATNMPTSNTPNPNLLGPTRTATVNFRRLSHLEMGDTNSVDINNIVSPHNHPIKEFFSVSVHTSDQPEEERERELGWRDAYEVMIKAPLRSLAQLARRMRRVRAEREEAMV
ncbi:hypothetical protein B0H65DRAFT_24357 [Neurospora tetraspora]|uniref:Uncharacterized protein n=1 Tax=Neurospora tetraspora TaxID=94610 RepID=A0AAE0JNB0_9PEZI|nr:hypothetical protein B0H65DRAFT_24357 [Neurospora tetraspora]